MRVCRGCRLAPLSRLLLSAIPVAAAQGSFIPSLRPGSRSLMSSPVVSCAASDGAAGRGSRVAVVGAGIAGSSFASTLHGQGYDVTVFEMGRGPGGRMATRKTREMPGLSVNHGVPVFTVTQPPFIEMLAPLVASGMVKMWDGAYFTLDARTRELKAGELPGSGYVGSPDMTSVCEALMAGCQQKYQCQVAQVQRGDGGVWMLTGPKSEALGEFDWLCVSSHTMGHPRWKEIFGSDLPLQSLIEDRSDAELQAMVTPLESVPSSPVMISMSAYSTEDPASDVLAQLPFDIVQVTNHDKIDRIVRHASDKYVSLVVHSTHHFATSHSNVYGSTSAAAKLAPGRWTKEEAKEREEAVVTDLYQEAQALLSHFAPELPKPVWGPHLHRWGAAFSGPYGAPTLPAVSHKHRFAVCGDFAIHSRPDIHQGVETAALSGIEAANAILAAGPMASSKI